MLLKQLDMCCALDMFASQTRDLYHIETDRMGGYIEPNKVRHIESAPPTYRQKTRARIKGKTFCSCSLLFTLFIFGEVPRRYTHLIKCFRRFPTQLFFRRRGVGIAGCDITGTAGAIKSFYLNAACLFKCVYNI